MLCTHTFWFSWLYEGGETGGTVQQKAAVYHDNAVNLRLCCTMYAVLLEDGIAWFTVQSFKVWN